MMSQSPLRRRIVSTLILLVIVSSIVPAVTLAGDAPGAQSQARVSDAVVAQQGGMNQTNAPRKVTTIIDWLKVANIGDGKLSPKEKRQIQKDLRALQSGTLSTKQEKQRLGRISNRIGYTPPKSMFGFGGEKPASLNHTIANVFNENIGGFTPLEKVPKSGDAKTMQVMTALIRLDSAYRKIGMGKRETIRGHIRYLQNRKNLTEKTWKLKVGLIASPAAGTGSAAANLTEGKAKQVKQIVIDELGPIPSQQRSNPYDINFSWLIDGKIKALTDALVSMFEYLFNEIYSHTLGTPVPENSGWHQVFGTPTNKPYNTLYQVLLVETLYPVMNYFLGLGVLFLGASFAVNPFMSRFRIWDLLTKFVAGLMFYAFGWTAVTLLHGTVRGITNFIVPDPKVVTESAGTLLAFGASVPVAAALGAALTAASSLLGVGVILGMRHFLLTTVFPYIFGPLMLVLYLSPWQRLRSYASMALWQYINILTMVIPIALVLKAAVALNWAFGDAVGFVFTLIGVLLFLLFYPIGSIYFFYIVSGSVASAARSGMSTASSQIKSATERVGWGGSDSANDTSATGGELTGSQAQALVSAEKQSGSSAASSASSSPSARTTTAQTIRDLYDGDDDDAMSPADMKEYVEQNPKTSTLKEDLGS